MPRSAILALSSLFLLATLGVWTLPAKGDAFYTEVLRNSKSRSGPFNDTRSQVYLTYDALRRAVLPKAGLSPQLQASIIPRLEGLIPRIEILRVDRGMAWRLSPEGKLESGRLRQLLRASDPFAEPAHLDALASLEPLSDRAVLRRSGLKKKRNGYVCDHLFATVTSDVRNRRTGETGTLVLMSDLWVAQDVPGTDEIRNFRRSLGELFGLDEYFCRDAALLAEALPEQVTKMAEMVQQVKVLPVSGTFTAKLRRGESDRTDGASLFSEVRPHGRCVGTARPKEVCPPIASLQSP